MADYYKQAAAEVDSYISAGKKVNAGARKQIIDEYALYLKQLDAKSAESAGALDTAQETERARAANRLAARGLGGDGAVQFNYGRLNATQQGNRTALYRDQLNNRATLLGAQGKAVGGVDAQDAALDAARLKSTQELGRGLEDRGRAFQYQQAQLALAQAQDKRAAAAAAKALQGDEVDTDAIGREAMGYMMEGATQEDVEMFLNSYNLSLSDFPYLTQRYGTMRSQAQATLAGYRANPLPHMGAPVQKRYDSLGASAQSGLAAQGRKNASGLRYLFGAKDFLFGDNGWFNPNK